jgi:pimeloyl-ACP methyl ester carboxylesterase
VILRRGTAVAAAALVVASLAGAGTAGVDRSATCFPSSAHAKVVRFANSEGTRLVGYELGRGTRGVVLVHQYGGDACQWAEFAPRLARSGYHVLAFDAHGYGQSPPGAGEVDTDVLAAASKLRALGARKLVLIGASMGGTAVLSAAAQLKPPPAAVVSLSGPGSFDLMSAYDAVPRLAMPKLFVAGSRDVQFVDDARELDRRARPPKRLVVVPTGDHGVDLLGDPRATRAVDALLRRAFG